MSTSIPSMRDLARRLLAVSRKAGDGSAKGGAAHVHDVAAVCETLRTVLTRFAGPDGFAALMRRALALASAEVPALKQVRLGPNCQLEGFENLAGREEGADAAVALAAHLLSLLVTFIGEPLTLRLVREAWPDADLMSEDQKGTGD